MSLQANLWVKGTKVLSMNEDLIGSNEIGKYIPSPHRSSVGGGGRSATGGVGRNNFTSIPNGYDLVIRNVKFGDAGLYGYSHDLTVRFIQPS